MNRATLEKILPGLILGICRVFAAEYVLGIAAWFALADGLEDRSGTPLGADFINVYAAGRLADQGHAPDVYNWQIHGAAEQAIAGFASPYYGWHYPPFFLLVAGLVALLPYLWALGIYLAVGFGVYVAALTKLAPQSIYFRWTIVAFPGAFINVINGQNGFITTALLAAGLVCLETQPYLAGAAFGLLIYKPQFFVVIPVLLLATGQGRALVMSLTTATLSLGLSWQVYGRDAWMAFVESTKATQAIVLEQGSTGWQKIQSIFSAGRMWGASVPVAYGLQVAVGASALIATVWLWRKTRDTALRGSALIACILLSTPYSLDYDLVVLSIPVVLLARFGLRHSFKRFEKLFLFCLWLLPFLARELGVYRIPLTPPLVVLLLLLCLLKMSPSDPAEAPS